MLQIKLDMGEKLAVQERLNWFLLFICIFIKICVVHDFWDTLYVVNTVLVQKAKISYDHTSSNHLMFYQS